MFKHLFLFLTLFLSITLMGAKSSKVNTLTGFESGSNTGITPMAIGSRMAVYDSSDLHFFPHLANEHKDLAQVYYAGENDFSGFATFNIMENFTLGVMDHNSQVQLIALPQDASGASHTYSLFGAYRLNNLDLGLSLDYWGFSNKTENKNAVGNTSNETSETLSASIINLKLSLGMKLAENMGFDSLLSLAFGGFTAEEYNSGANPKTQLVRESDTLFQLSLGGRYFMNATDSVKLTAWGFLNYHVEGFYDLDYSTNAKVKEGKLTSTTLFTNLGAGAEITSFNKKLLLTPSLGIIYMSNTRKAEMLTGNGKGSTNEAGPGTLALPYLSLSAEYHLKKWLSFYSGYTKFVTSEATIDNATTILDGNQTNKNEETVTESGVASNFSIGMSMQTENLTLTTTLSKGLLLNGPNFISGAVTPMFVSATLEYRFGDLTK